MIWMNQSYWHIWKNEFYDVDLIESWKSGIDTTLRNPWRTLVFDDYIWPICYKSSQSKVLLTNWCAFIYPHFSVRTLKLCVVTITGCRVEMALYKEDSFKLRSQTGVWRECFWHFGISSNFLRPRGVCFSALLRFFPVFLGWTCFHQSGIPTPLTILNRGKRPTVGRPRLHFTRQVWALAFWAQLMVRNDHCEDIAFEAIFWIIPHTFQTSSRLAAA